MGHWGGWTPCTRTCGGGNRTRTYIVTNPQSGAGAECPSPQTISCHSNSCPAQPCRGHWGTWTPCTRSCGGGTRVRSFVVAVNTSGQPGVTCPGPENETC